MKYLLKNILHLLGIHKYCHRQYWNETIMWHTPNPELTKTETKLLKGY